MRYRDREETIHKKGWNEKNAGDMGMKMVEQGNVKENRRKVGRKKAIKFLVRLFIKSKWSVNVVKR